MNRKIAVVFFAIVIIAGLVWFLIPTKKNNPLRVDVSAVQNKLRIHHFDDAFFISDSVNFLPELARLKVEFPPFFDSNSDSKFWHDNRLDIAQKMLYSDMKRKIPSFEPLDEKLTDAFAHLYYYYPNLPEFDLYTYISKLDFSNSIIVADRLIFVATDLYLGKNHPAYQYESSYLNYTKQPEFITTDVMERLAYTLAKRDNDDNTLLNDMIWWGKVIYFTEAMQPEANDTVLMRYSKKQLDFCEANHLQMWMYFVDNKLLFGTHPDGQRKFIEPAPYTKFELPFDAETPGMVGRWLGWQIVRSYMRNNPDVSLPQLMGDADSRTIFKNSKYKP
jgi:hypothetical protein